MQSVKTPREEISDRIRPVQSLIRENNLDGILVIHHINMFYFSGTSQSGHLFIPVEGEPLLMVRKSYSRACDESPLDNIIEMNSLKAILPSIEEHTGFKVNSIGLELDVIPYNTMLMYQKKAFPGIRIEDGSSLMKKVRMIKSKWEIDLLRNSCCVIDNAFAYVPEIIKEGMTEVELASFFEGYMRRNGYGGGSKMRAFNQDFAMGNVVSGSTGFVPTYFDGPVGGSGLSPANNPHGAGWKKIISGEPVYIDYTCVVNGYTADAERIFVLGESVLDDTLMHGHKTALLIQEEVMKQLKPGAVCSDIWALSEKIAAEEGLLNNFMGFGNERVKFLGHGVGLEMDEMPIFAKGFDLVLQPGMTFALEPKFVFEQGAVGIENTFVLTETGVEKINTYPEEINYISESAAVTS
ncbi:MAG: aminopeptidase P family protein [Spirochaetes bacterium]|nr:aminopeptidase P family protein [Spirochaetota bacterium]